MIWLYAICDRPELPAPRCRGLAQAPLEGLREDGLLAVISRHVDAPGDPVLDALWAHERVIESTMADRAVLPMRFGSKLRDDGALHALLAERQQEFLATLDRVRGRVEIGIRAGRANGAAEGAPAPNPVSGRMYLEGKLRDVKRFERDAAALHEELAPLAAATTRHAARQPEELLRASYLVERASVAGFRAAVEQLQRTHRDAAILCTGPWPPYSFVGAPT